MCSRAEAPEDTAPGRRCAATMNVASTTVRCEVVAYFPERRFATKPCRRARLMLSEAQTQRVPASIVEQPRPLRPISRAATRPRRLPFRFRVPVERRPPPDQTTTPASRRERPPGTGAGPCFTSKRGVAHAPIALLGARLGGGKERRRAEAVTGRQLRTDKAFPTDAERRMLHRTEGP